MKRLFALLLLASGCILEVPIGYTLLGVYGASADGSVVLGMASDGGALPKSFVLRLPVTAYGIAGG